MTRTLFARAHPPRKIPRAMITPPTEKCGLVARQLRLNRETLDNWRLYHSHREAVADLICRPPQPTSSRLCILGAGNCNDLDLARFSGRFARGSPGGSRPAGHGRRPPTAVSARPRQNQAPRGHRPHRHPEDPGYLGTVTGPAERASTTASAKPGPLPAFPSWEDSKWRLRCACCPRSWSRWSR